VSGSVWIGLVAFWYDNVWNPSKFICICNTFNNATQPIGFGECKWHPTCSQRLQCFKIT
jgi:putative component of membrane protein insertase Oxa1/YidC/SpoIIIJ protein YidD